MLRFYKKSFKKTYLCKLIRNSSYFTTNDDIFGLTSEEIQLRKTAFDFAKKELSPIAYDIDKHDSFPGFNDFMKKCGEMGFCGMAIPEEFGGIAASSVDQVIISEELSRFSPAIAMSFGAHSGLCSAPIVRFGTEEQKKKYLPKLASGELIGSLALSEVHAGSDVVNMKTTAVKKGDHYELTGSKFWITNGPIADIVVVFAKIQPSSNPSKSLAAFIIEKGMPGFTVGRKLDKLGMRGSPTGELIFDKCLVPAENQLGQTGRGAYMLMSGLDVERGIGASVCTGIMQACCDTAFEYAHQREAFGSKIGHFQLLQGKMADMYTRMMTARSFLFNVARSIDAGTIVPQDCAAIILYSAEKATLTALDAIQILGGNGYINDYPVGRYLRDAKLLEIGAGTSEIRRMVIGRNINAHYSK